MVKRIIEIVVRTVLYAMIIVVTAMITFIGRSSMIWNESNRALAVDWSDEIGAVINNIAYGVKSWQKYDLYLPVKHDANALILFVHGGGFTGGDKAEEDAWCKFFTSKGYVTASINYSILNGKCEDPNLNNIYAELLQGVAQIKDECHSRGYILNSMAISGQSAGGCLAMLYAFRAKEASALPVKFVFQQTGPVDFNPEGWGQADLQEKAAFVKLLTGEDISANLVHTDRYYKAINAISPAALVDSTSCPCLIAYGLKDKVVPPTLKFKLLEQLKKYGVPHDYVEYPNSGHGLINDPDKQDCFIDLAVEYCHRYL